LTVTEFHSFVRYQLLGAEKTRFLSNELPTVSTIYGGTDWPMLSLGATNIPEIDFATKQRDLHFQSLSRLGDQRLISVRTRLWAESLLDHWVATVEQSTTLPDQEQRALEDVMIILGAPSGDRVKAEALEEVQSDVYAVQPPRPPGISIQ
jgi:hypothetical protein